MIRVLLLFVAIVCSVGSKTSLLMGEQNIKRGVPLGIVQVVASDPGLSIAPVGIWAYNGIYSALGVSKEAFGSWQNKYGFDSLGVGAQGEIFVPEYPIFSKVAWMYIDPVDLSPPETEALITECERALLNARDHSTREELEAIRLLAVEAISHSATVRFGHP